MVNETAALLHLTLAGSRARSRSRKAARHLTDSEAKRVLHRLSAATSIQELRVSLSEAKPLAASLALQIPSLRPISSSEREKLVQDLCHLTVSMTAAQERLDTRLTGRSESPIVSEVLHGRRLADNSRESNEADKASIARVAARTTDALARLEVAEQRGERARTEASPAKSRAGIASAINAAVSVLATHVSPARRSSTS